MIPPQVIRGLFALAAAGIAKLTGEALGEHFDRKAHEELKGAEEYVRLKRMETVRRRRGCLETVLSYSQMIKAAVQAPVGPLTQPAAELPADLQAAWERILDSLQAISPSGAQVIQVREDPDFAKKVAISYSRAQQQVGPAQASQWAAFTAAAYYGFHGVKGAINSKSFLDQAKVGAEAARVAADRQLAAVGSTEEMLAMMSNSIPPLIHRAVGPPRDDRYAATALQFADLLTSRAEQMLRVAGDE